jgi:hypothetical protein
MLILREEASGKIAVPNRHGIQEPQRRDGPVDRRRTRTLLVLMDLEIAKIVSGHRVGGPAEKAGAAAWRR